MSLSGKIIVTIAPTGGLRTKRDNPHIPTQPGEIADDVERCYNAGASMTALHARLANDEATCDAEIYRDINARVRARCPIIINNSTGGGMNGDMVRPLTDGLWEVIWAQRLRALDGGAEMATLNAMTVVACLQGRETLFSTTPARCREMAAAMKERGIKPEWEAFSTEHLLQDMRVLIDEGVDAAPHFINLALGFDQIFQGAMPWSPRALLDMVAVLPPKVVMSVSGAGPAQLPAVTQMLLLGGHVRVGLEDNLFYAPGEPATNVQLVDRAVRLVRELGFEPATPEEARDIIGLKQLSAGVAA